MPDSNARIVRGLSIATVVISVLAILAVLAVAVLLAVLGSYMNDPAFVQRVIDEAYSQGSSVHGITANDVTMLVSLGIGTILAALVWSAICSALALVAGIVGIRNSRQAGEAGHRVRMGHCRRRDVVSDRPPHHHGAAHRISCLP